jgi:DNA-binding FadR family transcriptional regulator
LDEFIAQSRRDVPGSKEEAFLYAEINCRFHLEIAEASRNSVVIALMKLILPDVLAFSRNNFGAYTSERVDLVAREHESIFQAIQEHDLNRAEKAMQVHMLKMIRIAEGLDKIFTNTVALNQHGEVLKK